MSKSDQPDTNKRGDSLKDAAVDYRVTGQSDIDLFLLKDSLAKTPWERMLENDDALNFAESLRTAMQNRHAKS